MKHILLGVLSVILLALTGCSKNSKESGNQSTALLIIDVQNDYFPGGKMPLSGEEEAAKKVKHLLEYHRAHNMPVIHIRHIATEQGATFFLPNTSGAEINDLVAPREDEKVIIKHYPNSFRETDLLGYLKSKGITRLIVCGMMTDVCVDATVRAAKDYNMVNLVISDACATHDRELNGEIISASDVQESYLAGMAALNDFYTQVTTTEQYLKDN